MLDELRHLCGIDPKEEGRKAPLAGWDKKRTKLMFIVAR